MTKNVWDTIIASYIKPGDVIRHKSSGEHGIVIRRFPALSSTFIEVKFTSCIMAIDYKEVEKVFEVKNFHPCKLPLK